MDDKTLKIVFMGTSDFGIPVLNMLKNENYRLVSVVTLPDRIAGRGKKSTPVAIKKRALELDIPLLETDDLRDKNFQAQLKSLNPDIFVVIAFRILPSEVINIANVAAINLHASLLPKYRGPAPINHAIINGETKTGITVFKIDENIDTGNIILQEEIDIKPSWNAGNLYEALSELGPESIKKAIHILQEDNPIFFKQADTLATKAPKLHKEDALIDWNMFSVDLVNKIRGTNPFPGAFTYFRGKILKIKTVEILDAQTSYTEFGKIINISPNGITVSCKKGAITLKSVAPEGKNEIDIASFINGYRPVLGECLTKF